jgi:hypothetical protein
LISGVARAQSDRATATTILVAALRAVPIDSLCHRCSVVVVDTAIRGARNSYGLGVQELPVVAWAESRALRDLDAHGRHWVPGGYRLGPLAHDSVLIAVEFVPPRLTMMDSGEVYMQIDFEDRSYGYALIARVQRVGKNGVPSSFASWRASPGICTICTTAARICASFAQTAHTHNTGSVV